MKARLVILHGACAKQMIKAMARNYALLSIHSKLPADTMFAPWSSLARGKSWTKTHAAWIAKVDRERVAYRKSLESILAAVPPVPQMEWVPYVATNSKRYSVFYDTLKCTSTVNAYATAFMEKLK